MRRLVCCSSACTTSAHSQICCPWACAPPLHRCWPLAARCWAARPLPPPRRQESPAAAARRLTSALPAPRVRARPGAAPRPPPRRRSWRAGWARQRRHRCCERPPPPPREELRWALRHWRTQRSRCLSAIVGCAATAAPAPAAAAGRRSRRRVSQRGAGAEPRPSSLHPPHEGAWRCRARRRRPGLRGRRRQPPPRRRHAAASSPAPLAPSRAGHPPVEGVGVCVDSSWAARGLREARRSVLPETNPLSQPDARALLLGSSNPSGITRH